ncbi:hypothetical protein [Pseudomarimonas salicorniae]|uniref:Uncharacterized protein n=1 Tax=Pseudomarimonas salicorniae TaxID=2933270 RepID=A0ABT0GLA0_9GAMM|nr:hypothetical protein [Lysobacter sp. CAU 1642]MCK7595314.1 hypothetical protein [Lysobacter sp. CAU 1642]
MAFVFGAGLVLTMYPAELLAYGATCLGSDGDPVESETYFLCLESDASGGLWTPLHRTRGQDREPIPEDNKTGFPEFVRGHSYYSTRELWQVPHKAAKKASAACADKSGPKLANRISGRWMPTLDKFPAAPSG